MSRFVGDGTRVVDLTGRLALPGFHDAHIHPLSSGHAMLGCPLQAAQSVESLLEALLACARESDEEWVVGDDFDLGLFPGGNPRKAPLDAVLPDRPVLVRASDGHSSWVNSRALERAGITAETPDPPQGVIERDAASGEPSGTLRESAQQLVASLVPQPTFEEDLRALSAALFEINRHGITSFIEAAAEETHWRAYRALADQRALSARVVTSLVFDTSSVDGGEDFERALAERRRYASARLRTDAVKLFLDGVLEGETAALLEPYLGMGEHRGELNFEPQALAAAPGRLRYRFDAPLLDGEVVYEAEP